MFAQLSKSLQVQQQKLLQQFPRGDMGCAYFLLALRAVSLIPVFQERIDCSAMRNMELDNLTVLFQRYKLRKLPFRTPYHLQLLIQAVRPYTCL